LRSYHGRTGETPLKARCHAGNDPASPIDEAETTCGTADCVRLVPKSSKSDTSGRWIIRKSGYGDNIMRSPDGPHIVKENTP